MSISAARVTRFGISGATWRPAGDFSGKQPTVVTASVALSASLTEALVVAGGETITITLVSDTWVASGATFNAQRQAIIDGLDSDGAELLGWNNELRDKEVVGSVARSSDTVVTITLTAAAAYDITADETITVTIPAAALTAAGEVTATPTFDVTFIAVVVAADIIEGAGGGKYQDVPYRTPEEIIAWLESYFPESEQETEDLDFANEPYTQVIEVETVSAVPPPRSMSHELAQLDRIRELHNESLKLEKRAKTVRVQRKLNQITRDRDRIKAEVVRFEKRVRGRRRRDERAILKIIDEMF